jgi:hypothetical protein
MVPSVILVGKLVGLFFGPHHPLVAHFPGIDAQRLGDRRTEGCRLDQHRDEDLLTSARRSAFRPCRATRWLRSLPAFISWADDLEFVGQRRGRTRLDFLGHPEDRLVERLTRLDADQHHVKRVGKAVRDLFLALLQALGPSIWAACSRPRPAAGSVIIDLLRRRLARAISRSNRSCRARSAADARGELREVIGLHRVLRPVARLQQRELRMADNSSSSCGSRKFEYFSSLSRLAAVAQRRDFPPSSESRPLLGGLLELVERVLACAFSAARAEPAAPGSRPEARPPSAGQDRRSGSVSISLMSKYRGSCFHRCRDLA